MASTKKKRRKKINYHGPYSFEFRLRVVRMYLEERYPLSLICNETGVSDSSVQTFDVAMLTLKLRCQPSINRMATAKDWFGIGFQSLL